MTTTVTVKAHAWPVQVTTVDRYSATHNTGGAEQRVVTQTTTVEVVPPNSTRDFHITNTRSIAFDELPLPIADAEFVEAE
jgi:arginyl-tRNA synthetase